jgi:hypothetical protein
MRWFHLRLKIHRIGKTLVHQFGDRCAKAA